MKDDFFVEKGKNKPNKLGKKRAIDEHSDSGQDIDDLNLQHSDVESDDSQMELERHETPAQKRLRLAKSYLSKVETEFEMSRGDIDAAEIDKDLISQRLQLDANEVTGNVYHRICHLFENLPLNEASIRSFTGGNKKHRLSVTCVTVSIPPQKFSESGSSPPPIYVFSASKDGSITKWDFWTGERLFTVPGGLKKTKKIKAQFNEKNLKAHIGHTDSVLCMDTSDDGKYLVTGGKDHLIHIWSVSDMKHMGTFKQHRAAISGLVFRKGHNQLYSASFDRCIKLWNIDDMAYIETLFGHQDEITCIDSLFKERCLSSGSRDRTVRMWKIVEESQLIFRGTCNVIDSTIEETNNENHEVQITKEKGSSGGSIDVVALLDEDTFISGGDNGSISLWNVGKKKPLFTKPKAHSNSTEEQCCWIISLAALPFSDLFASGSGDGQIKLWKLSENKRSFTLLKSIPMLGFVNSLKFTAASLDLAPPQFASLAEHSTQAREVLEGKKQLHLVAGIGQEHKRGRWYSIKGVKNDVKVIQLN